MRAFKQRQPLRAHVVGGEVGLKRDPYWRCPTCREPFLSRYAAKAHARIAHKGKHVNAL